MNLVIFSPFMVRKLLLSFTCVTCFIPTFQALNALFIIQQGKNSASPIIFSASFYLQNKILHQEFLHKK
jgi:hypothetical protein